MFILDICDHRYVDVSTVDGATSKLICESVKKTGASFLEVNIFYFLSPTCCLQNYFISLLNRLRFQAPKNLLKMGNLFF